MKRTTILWAWAALAMAGCSKDEAPDGHTLPEGQYPLEIASVTMRVESSSEPWGAGAPQTRVAENADGNGSVWQDDDKMSVQIGNGTPGTYTYYNGSLTVAEGDTPAYWPSKDDNQSIRAWYTNPDYTNENNVTLSDQTNALAYVLTAQATADFNETVPLEFAHALAKVRVTFSSEGTADLTNASVSILAPTSCTVNGGIVTAGAVTDYIPMHKVTYGSKDYYEANVTPGLTLDTEAFKVEVNGKTALCSTTAVTPQAGQCHAITLKVDNAPITLAYDTPININDNGTYTINGIPSSLCNATITIEGSPTVTLNNVGIRNSNGNCIHIKSGSPTIILEGENLLRTDNKEQAPVFHIGASANVTIKGEGELTIQVTRNAPAIGAGLGETCGNITIQGCTIKAYTNQATGIGSGDGSCGNITIKDATVDVTGGPAIGAGSPYGNNSCGDILIENTALTAAAAFSPGYRTATIGCGSLPLSLDVSCEKTCGTITITHNTKTIEEILSFITEGTPLIGKIENSTKMTSSCGLITITGRDGTKTYDGVCNGVTN